LIFLESADDLIKLLVEYFQLFGDKSACFLDLCTYLDLLEPTSRSEVCWLYVALCEIIGVVFVVKFLVKISTYFKL
jgi:hypothetical protein